MSTAGLLRADALAIPLASRSVHLSLSSPPYFALRSYEDDGEHYDGQIGSEDTPTEFLRALWRVYDEVYRVLRDDGSCFVNLGDKMAGSGGHNNAGLPGRPVPPPPGKVLGANGHGATSRDGISNRSTLQGNGHRGGVGKAGPQKIKATRRSAPDRYNQTADVLRKSLMGLPWRFAMGLICPDLYRNPIDPPVTECWHEDQPCMACRGSWPQWVLRSELIWSKPNGLPESVTDRVRRSHEQWFHFTKSPNYFAAMDEIRVPAATADPSNESYRENKSNKRRKGLTAPPGQAQPSLATAARAATADTALPSSVWTVSTEPFTVPDELGVDHFAAFPTEWPRRIILGWSPAGICSKCGEGRRPVVERTPMIVEPSERRGVAQASGNAQRTSTSTSGTMTQAPSATIVGYSCACPDTTADTTPAVVLDPFGGTGTTAMVARALGRFGVHLDLSADYLRLAQWRVFESGHADKSVKRTNAERAAGGRADLVTAPFASDSLFGGAA